MNSDNANDETVQMLKELCTKLGTLLQKAAGCIYGVRRRVYRALKLHRKWVFNRHFLNFYFFGFVACCL